MSRFEYYTAQRASALFRPSRPACTIRDTRAAAEFRPCIDIHKGQVKQIVGGTLRDIQGGTAPVENFVSTRRSSYFARLYQQDDLRGGHVIILGQDKSSVSAAKEALATWPQHLQFGGGVTTANALQWLEAGAAKLIVTSFAFSDGQLQQGRLDELVALIGRERLVLDLSCRKQDDGEYYVVADRWQKFTKHKVNQKSLAALAASCSEFLVHGVDVEGKQLGVDEELIRLLGAHSPIPATYAGGVLSLDDLHLVARAGRGDVNITVGSALDIFGGGLAYADVVQWHRHQASSPSRG